MFTKYRITHVYVQLKSKWRICTYFLLHLVVFSLRRHR